MRRWSAVAATVGAAAVAAVMITTPAPAATSPPCWPSSGWPTVAKRLPMREMGNLSPSMGSCYRSAAPLAVPRFVDVKS